MTSIFAAEKAKLFTQYTATIQFRDRVVGATPSNPKLIEGWIRSKAGITREDEIRQMTVKTLVELGLISEDVLDDPEATYDSISQAAEAIAKKSQTQMFKRDEDGLYLESRVIKAMLREAVNIAYPWSPENKWGVTRKGAKSYFVETTFVNPDHISLGVPEPSGIDLFVGHVSGPQGPRSTLGYYEYVERATLTLEVIVMHDGVKEDQWATIWSLGEEIGLGAMRSQGFGRFDVLAWGPSKKTNGAVTRMLESALH